MKKKIAIAISGGIDSLVSAYLLKEQGHDVVGIHFLTGYEQKPVDNYPSSKHPISLIGEQLGIDIHILDCTEEFRNTVVKYFLNVYQAGQTPNPCMVCNPTIKFGAVLNHAFKLGASHLATGHYARTLKDSDNNLHLICGTDAHKDQSYFLAFINQNQLSAAKFPLGDMTKTEVRELALKKNLKPITSDESQDICFINDINYKEFFRTQMDMDVRPGLIEDLNGRIIGAHMGLHMYTIGQRRGINCPSSKPYYVVKIDTPLNRLIVGRKDDLMCSEFKVRDINWIIQAPDNQIAVKTRVRYRSKAYDTTVIPIDNKTALVKFNTPQPSVAPGQAAAFYKDNEVLGGGWILPY